MKKNTLAMLSACFLVSLLFTGCADTATIEAAPLATEVISPASEAAAYDENNGYECTQEQIAIVAPKSSYRYASGSDGFEIFYDKDSVSIDWGKKTIKVRTVWAYMKKYNIENPGTYTSRAITFGNYTVPERTMQFNRQLGYDIESYIFDFSNERFKRLSSSTYKCDGTEIGTPSSEGHWKDYMPDTIIGAVPEKILKNAYMRIAYILGGIAAVVGAVFLYLYYKRRQKSSDMPERHEASRVELNVCPACGAENIISAKFCTKCGSKILDTEKDQNVLS